VVVLGLPASVSVGVPSGLENRRSEVRQRGDLEERLPDLGRSLPDQPRVEPVAGEGVGTLSGSLPNGLVRRPQVLASSTLNPNWSPTTKMPPGSSDEGSWLPGTPRLSWLSLVGRTTASGVPARRCRMRTSPPVGGSSSL
jgi:hypothetical protein